MLVKLATIFAVILHTVHGYCLGVGMNPSFKAAPIVEQTGPTSVKVLWDGLVTNIECADNFVVMYWKKYRKSEFKMSPLLPTDHPQHRILGYQISDLLPGEKYIFQVSL